MKVLAFIFGLSFLFVGFLLVLLGILYSFPAPWNKPLPLVVALILGLIAILCEISAILLNGVTLPTRKNQRRPYLYDLLKLGHIIFIFMGIFSLASAALRFQWPQ